MQLTGRLCATVVVLATAAATIGSVHHVRMPPPDFVRAIVRVETAGCPGGARQGSGFVWNSSRHVVTALHVVAGCSSVLVNYPAGVGLKKATVLRALRAEDLALLQISNPPPVQPLAVSGTMPDAGTPMIGWGYPKHLRSIWDTEFIRRQSNARLEDVLITALRNELIQVGMPSLQTRVIWLDRGHLHPGQSGGPLVDANGRVVGIANGGLEQGASTINWAIPTTRLSALLASAEATPSSGPSGLLFAGEIVEGASFSDFVDPFNLDAAEDQRREILAAGFSCGEGLLVRTRTRTFAELTLYTDDPQGLQQLTMAAGPLLEPSARFDLYQHLESGATAVVPAGARLREEGGLCVASLNDGEIEIYIQTAPANGPFAIQQASLRFEGMVAENLGDGFWQTDPAWTMVLPLNRPDGLVARRIASVQYGPSFQPAKYAFESLSARGGMFLGVASIRMDIGPGRMQRQSQRLVDPSGFGCDELLDELVQAVRASIGVHLSTFPLG